MVFHLPKTLTLLQIEGGEGLSWGWSLATQRRCLLVVFLMAQVGKGGKERERLMWEIEAEQGVPRFISGGRGGPVREK